MESGRGLEEEVEDCCAGRCWEGGEGGDWGEFVYGFGHGCSRVWIGGSWCCFDVLDVQ